MTEIFKLILESLKGHQVDAMFAFVVIFTILVLCGYFIFKYTTISIKRKGKEETGDTKIILSAEEWIKSEEGNNYLEDIILTRIILNDDRISDKISKKIDADLKLKIFEETKVLYERISKMREDFAGNYIVKEDIRAISKELDLLQIDIAKLKGKMNID